MATIRDVARLANCSPATVSRFFNRRCVSADAEGRIRRAVDELSYAPSVLASNLKRNRSTILGMIIPDITEPFFPAVVKGVEDVTRANHLSLMLFNTQEDETREGECVDIVKAHRCDGLLLIKAPRGPQHERCRARLATLPVPLVYLDRAPDAGADAVLVDNVTGARRGVEHLLRLGHRRIAIVMMGRDVPTHLERLAGYRWALRDFGVEARADYVQRTEPTLADAYSATLQTLSLPEPPTAIFATNARITLGVMAAIRSQGLRCPDDISVLGHDGFDWQTVFAPRLSIIEQPAYLMGVRAAELLIQRINGSAVGSAQRIILNPELVVRESCGVYRDNAAK